MIQTTEEIKRLSKQLQQQPCIAIDTEFYWRSTYYPTLCLIQIATETDCYIIDPLAENLDLSALKDVLEHPNILKIMHACSQDIKILYHELNAKTQPLFDTQKAAAFLGMTHQGSLNDLLERLHINTIDKSQTMTDWRRRPLSDEQLHYAKDDVIYLVEAYHQLIQLLKDQGKLSWIMEDFTHISQNDSNYQYTHPDQAYLKIGAFNRCDYKGKQIVKSLAHWRETYAQQENISPQWVLSNKSIIEIAHKKPEHYNQLQQEDFKLNKKQLKKHYAIILQIVKNAQSSAPTATDIKKPKSNITTDMVKQASEQIAYYSEQHNIIPQAVAAKQEIKKFLASNYQESHLANGWRYDYFGKPLIKSIQDS